MDVVAGFSSRKFATRGNVAAWLLTLARSRAINRLRARRARPDRLAGELALTDVADQTPAVDVQLLSAEQVARDRDIRAHAAAIGAAAPRVASR